MLVIKAGIHKMLVRIAIREDPDRTASDMGLHHLSRSLATKQEDSATCLLLTDFTVMIRS